MQKANSSPFNASVKNVPKLVTNPIAENAYLIS